MMKRKIASLFLAVLLIAATATGCSSEEYTGNYSKDETSAQAPGYAPSPGMGAIYEEGYADGDYALDYGQEKPAYDIVSTASEPAASDDKIIYSYNASIETVKFDETLEAVEAMISKYGAFIESSSVTGNNYHSSYYGNSYRTANYMIRVPKQSYKLMSDEIAALGNLIYGNTQALNITSQFVDTESRLNAYKIEESRLLEMLEKAETVADMITIETRLSEVRYNIESLTSTLNNWTMQVEYSTINLTVSEVKELTPEVTIPRTLGEEITDALNKTFGGLKEFFRNALVVIVAALPILVIAAVITFVVLMIVKIRSNRKKKKFGLQSGINTQQHPGNGQGQS